jgi:integrase
MARRRGTGSIFKRPGCKTWTIKFSARGRTIREATGERDYSEAMKRLTQRLGELDKGAFIEPEVRRIQIQELADDFLRDYKINCRKSAEDAETRWRLHLKPFFGAALISEVSSRTIEKYIDGRLEQGAQNATVNRELAALKRMFRLGYGATPPKVSHLPNFPRLQEDNVRTGFVEDEQYARLTAAATDLWLRALIEVAHTYGWRRQELLNLRVRQVDLISATIRLDPGTTKNRDGREASMTPAVQILLGECVRGKAPEDYVFTRENKKPVRDFRAAWATACIAACLGRMICKSCEQPVSGEKCQTCGAQGKGLRYSGLIFHDARRTAARNLRRAGVAEGVIMRIGGWRTRNVFERYNIVSQADIVDALQKLEQRRAERIELERVNEERRKNPTFDFGTNTVPIGVAVGGPGGSRKVN